MPTTPKPGTAAAAAASAFQFERADIIDNDESSMSEEKSNGEG